ncbi:MAG: peptide deformylase [Candidatus Hydrogenedens sp.]|nr:peptide deformylase [Candidatus Hydrogenedentota bacterium]NLF57917.1 peptide deformylase [Candidatus Hydrogenedens sp.]
MALLKIVHYPDEPLTRKAEPVTEFGPELEQFAQDMVETMFENEGVGLAAPQVGVSRRMLVLCEPDGEPMCLVNPELSCMEGREYGEEGCLSLPQVYARVPRAVKIHVKALDVEGNPFEFEASDFLARIIQHECDHLDGIVFPDRLDVFTRETVLQEWEEKRGCLAVDAAAGR